MVLLDYTYYKLNSYFEIPKIMFCGISTRRSKSKIQKEREDKYQTEVDNKIDSIQNLESL